MKKGKIVLIVVLCLLLALLTGALVYFYPRWQSAGALQENVDLEHFAYEIDLELNGETLPRQAKEALQTLSDITGFEPEVFYNLRFKGNLWEDKIYIQLYTDVAEKAVLELYLSDDSDIINGTMLYNAFRVKMVGNSSLLNSFIPVMEDGVYMTVEQAEKVFGLDLSMLSELSLNTEDMDFTRQEYFVLLALMSRQKENDGSRFTFEYESAKAEISLDGQDELHTSAQIDVQNPAAFLAEVEEKLASLGVEVPVEGLDIFKSVTVIVEPGVGEEIVIPTNIISQEMIELIAEARALIEQFKNLK